MPFMRLLAQGLPGGLRPTQKHPGAHTQVHIPHSILAISNLAAASSLVHYATGPGQVQRNAAHERRLGQSVKERLIGNFRKQSRTLTRHNRQKIYKIP